MICKPCTCDADSQKAKDVSDLPPCDVDCSGHQSCKGCDCQHKPVKEGQITDVS